MSCIVSYAACIVGIVFFLFSCIVSTVIGIACTVGFAACIIGTVFLWDGFLVV
jgi:hypothetical protein